MGLSSGYNCCLPKAMATALLVSCFFFLLSPTSGCGPTTALGAVTKASQLDLEEFYQGYLDQPYEGQDPVALPPMLKSALGRFLTNKHKAAERGKAATVTAGVGGAMLAAAPFLRFIGSRGRSSRHEGTTATGETPSPAPPEYQAYVDVQKEHNGISPQRSFPSLRVDGREVASNLATASAVLGAALLVGAIGTYFSKLSSRATNEADRQRIRAILVKRMEQMAVNAKDTVSYSHWDLGKVADAMGRPLENQVQEGVVGAPDSSPKVSPVETPAPPASPTTPSPGVLDAAEAGAAEAGAPRYGKRGIWIGLSDQRSDTPSELADVKKFVKLARETGNAAVYYPN